MLTAEGLTKSYGKTVVLSEAGISVAPGRITVLIGPSGSGKTTLLQALAMLDPPDSGTIRVDDLTYEFPRAREDRRAPPWPMLTVVFQQLFLWPHLTLRGNILLPVKARMGSRDRRRLDDLVERFEMGDFIDRYPNQVSGGQRQRAALARALMLNPRYILLDEITSALDVEQTSIILDYLLALRGEGIGLLLVTHLISFARGLAGRGEGDRVVFMDRGHVLEAGGANVLENPQHERLRRFLSHLEKAR